jgi:hypothetical protein
MAIAIIATMWEIDVICSDPDCAEGFQLWVADLDEADRAVCQCECSAVTVAVAIHRPIFSLQPLRETAVKGPGARAAA